MTYWTIDGNPLQQESVWGITTILAVVLFLLPGKPAFAQCAATDASTVSCSGSSTGLTIVPPPPPGAERYRYRTAGRHD
ncbi:hypothetical protein LGM75_07635 [Burkholderia multivorans]|uniref:hypothetical protein n=1 Tax=Burkholderia multivorans TaxID=87883 RepID=UPI001C24DE25|nr:hypothetical protein [Burkholderia multivorans]MBU9465478.1 hypothetical protein [Burkholderia multivorans]MCA8126218.1 hypothetical protein [Burkholderia multivorans]